VPDPSVFLPLASFGSGTASTLFAYVGLGPGQEFIPQFLALLVVAGTALVAVLQWPFVALLRRVKRTKKTPTEQSTVSPTEAMKHGGQPLDVL
jgi:hypothetical protein